MLLLDRRTERAIGAQGIIALALGAAAITVQVGWIPVAEVTAALRGAALSLAFVRITLGAMVLGCLLVAAAAVMALARRPGRVGGAGAILMLAASSSAVWSLRSLLRVAGPVTLAWATAIAAAALVAYGLGRLLRLHRAIRWLDARLLDPVPATPGQAPHWPASTIDRVLVGTTVVATLVVVAAPHVGLILAAAVVAAIASDLHARRAGRIGRLPLLPILALLLVPVYWLMATIAGPLGLSLDVLRDGPLSPAAQTLLVPPLALAAVAFAALPPFHGRTPGVLLAPIGIALLVRVGVGLLPDGMLHWQPALVAVGVGALWYGAATGRAHLLLSAGAVLGVASLDPRGILGSCWLLAAALVLTVRPRLTPAGAVRSHASPWILVWLAGGWGAILVLGGLVQTEVVYTLLAAAAVAAAVEGSRSEPVPDSFDEASA